MGLRLGETLNIRVGDIDSERALLHVRQAKGNKDRRVILPQSALSALRAYWRTHRNPTWLFPSGRTPLERHQATDPMDRGGTQKSFKAIVAHGGIHKDITIHTLRHCYRTLLNYYMVTFTLPKELRGLAKAHSKTVYDLLMRCAADTLKTFARNDKTLAGELGFCAVLHTHTRRLDYHPHVHMVVPGGVVHCGKFSRTTAPRSPFVISTPIPNNGKSARSPGRSLLD